MEIKKIIFLSVFAFFLGSCEKKSANVFNNQEIKEVNPKEFIELDKKFQKIEFIKLETLNNCLISWPKKIEIIDNKIIVLDKNERVYVFDISGKFLNQIGTIGSGPQELLSITNFFIDHVNKNIILFDRYKSEMCRYSLSGKLIKKTKTENTGYFSDIVQVGNSTILLSMGNIIGQESNYRLLDSNKFNLKKELLPFPVLGNELLYTLPKVANCNGTFYGLSMMSDTIYKFQDDFFYPYLLLKGKFKHRDEKMNEELYLKGPYDVSFDAAALLSKNGYSQGIYSIQSAGNFLYFVFLADKDEYIEILWDTENDKGYKYKDKEEYKSIFYSMDFKYGTYNNAIICLLPIESVMEDDSNHISGDVNIDSLTENLQFDDNPIIGLYYMNKN